MGLGKKTYSDVIPQEVVTEVINRRFNINGRIPLEEDLRGYLLLALAEAISKKKPKGAEGFLFHIVEEHGREVEIYDIYGLLTKEVLEESNINFYDMEECATVAELKLYPHIWEKVKDYDLYSYSDPTSGMTPKKIMDMITEEEPITDIMFLREMLYMFADDPRVSWKNMYYFINENTCIKTENLPF